MRRSPFHTMRIALVPSALVVCGCVPVPELLLDIQTVNQGSVAQAIVPTTSGFYLVARMANTGEEIFYTPDGTVEGATADNILDVRPGALSSSPRSVYTVGERAFFAAEDGTIPNAQSLYVTDGTKSTTVSLRPPAPTLKITGFAPWGAGGMLFKMSDASTPEELYRTDGTAAGTQMIADINPTGSSQPAGMTPVGGAHVFAATDGAGDRELWRTDGMTATRLADLRPGGSSAPSGFVRLGGKVFFSATIAGSTVGLYATDGTAAGTARVSTVSGSSLVLGTATSTQVFFVVNKNQLWVSDGTGPGTGMVTSVPLNSNGHAPTEFRTLGNRVVFYVETDESDMDIIEDMWSSDGTPAGTAVFQTSQAVHEHGVAFASKLYFTKSFGLYRTDGTAAGTETVHSQPGFGASLLTDVHGTLFMTSSDSTHGNELWTKDASIGPPAFFADVNSGTGSSFPNGFTPFGNRSLFVAAGNTTGNELYVTDGTPAGTALVADISPGQGSSFPGWFTERNGIVYFNANDVVHGDELWRTDGTPAGTFLVKDIYPGDWNSIARPYAGPTTVFVHARTSTHGIELWTTDGTAAGTVLFKDINPGSADSRPSSFATLGSKVVFTATTPAAGMELWISDGTAAGTVLLKDINPGSASSDVFVTPMPMGGHLYFVANDGTHGKELWRTEGTPAGTTRVTDLNPGAGNSVQGGGIAMGGELFFDGFDGARQEMWKTDGVTTTMVTGGINPSGSNASPGVAIGATLYFTATHPQKGNELHATDGTAAGVRLVKDINPAPNAGSGIGEMAALGDVLYFNANNGADGAELWSTDGTEDGTVMNSGGDHDPFAGNPRFLAASNGILYMQLVDPVHGAEPYTINP